jgi:hypothetical protein
MKKNIKDTTKDLISKTKSAYYITKESIQSIGDKTPQPKTIYDLEEMYQEGMVVGEEETLIQALHECFSIEASGGRIASSPELVLMRNKGQDHIVWDTSFDTFSTEHVGVDTKGIFGPPAQHVIVFAHNTGIPSIHTILDEKLKSSVLEMGVRYPQTMFDQLLSGKTQDGLEIDLYPIDEYHEGYRSTPYGLVMPITQEEMDRRKKLIFAKGINEKFPEQSYYLSPIAKGRSGLDTESLKEYVENCLISTHNKPFFFDYFDYKLPFYGEAEVRIINVTRLGFQINNQNNPHIFYGIKFKETEKQDSGKGEQEP